jgi:hypothetical protein
MLLCRGLRLRSREFSSGRPADGLDVGQLAAKQVRFDGAFRCQGTRNALVVIALLAFTLKLIPQPAKGRKITHRLRRGSASHRSAS